MTGRSWRKVHPGGPLCAAVGVLLALSCYSTGNGTPPPANTFYYPVGLAVSEGGNVLYAVNSDFDLQYSGGTIQSYDLTAIRGDVVRLMLGLYAGGPAFDAGPNPFEGGAGSSDSGSPPPTDGGDAGAADDAGDSGQAGDAGDGGDAGDAGEASDAGDGGEPADSGAPAPTPTWNPGSASTSGPLPFGASGAGGPTDAGCPYTQLYPAPTNPNDPGGWNNQPGRLPIGQACAPPMVSTGYYRDSVVIGAFATDLQLSKDPATPLAPRMGPDRLFSPVRGDATLTWIDVASDLDAGAPAPSATPSTYPPFYLSCNRNRAGQCDSLHHAGQLTDPGNTRQLTMPGEPFAMAISDDGTAIAVTHQAEADTSLFLTGQNQGVPSFNASLQFYVDNMPLGGDGIVAIPHDMAAVPNASSANPLRPAFLQTSNAAAEIDLLRYYTDEGWQGLLPVDGGGANVADAGLAVRVGSSNLRPFLVKERQYGIGIEANGNNQRGIAIDPTPRIACEQALPPNTPMTDPAYVACAQTPARVFIASRSPASLIVGSIGAMSEEGGQYDPDALTLYKNVSLSAGPSNIYVAPIVDKSGRYSVRVFVVCFDSQTIAIYDPDTGIVENQVLTGPGPFAMAFDPFDLDDVATHAEVPYDPRFPNTIVSKGTAMNGMPALRKYRFAYITSFTDSYVQIMDLDQSFQDDRLMGVSTFETMVYSLGIPQQPVQTSSN